MGIGVCCVVFSSIGGYLNELDYGFVNTKEEFHFVGNVGIIWELGFVAWFLVLLVDT